MRSLAGLVLLAVLLTVGPLAAEDITDPPAAATAAAAPQAVDMPAGEPQPAPKADALAQPTANSLAAIGSDVVAAPTGVVELAPTPPPPPPITLVLNADLRAQRLTVIENGKTRYTWPISSGRSGFATPTGTFHPQWASKMWYSRQYEYAPMPHAVFFHRGTAFHGTGAVGLLGQPASHGCVRLAPGNAAQLFKLVHQHGYASTKVVVHGGSRNKEPAVARRAVRVELASARAIRRDGTRVSRASARRSGYLAE
jgi:lipoprotein-anchoring transpeptidase ErfK/SrfK